MTDTHTHTDLQLHIFSGPKNEQKSIAYVFPHLFVLFCFYLFYLFFTSLPDVFPLPTANISSRRRCPLQTRDVITAEGVFP